MCRVFLMVLMFAGLAAYSQPRFDLSSKLSPAVLEAVQRRGSDSIEVSISFRGKAELGKTLYLSPSGFHVSKRKIAFTDIPFLVSDKDVLFINELQIPREELTTGAFDLTLNRINYVQQRFPGVNGDSLNCLIKERAFDRDDIDLKGRIFSTGWEAPTSTSHASLMATVIAGGGNSSPFARGCATASKVGSADFQNLFPEPDSLFQLKQVRLQNHSYGTIVENMYGNEAAAYDVQAHSIPDLVHVFSAGNSGASTSTTGMYANIPGLANLTGNFKQAKNIITVGSLDSAGQLMPLSSKGPAFDGRVKPELMAYGEDGSSGAAATVSGAVLLVQHAWKKAHGQLPASSVVKAVLINSANEAGEAHPDYFTGYGSLNAFKAVATINENRVIENTLLPNEVKTMNLVIPANMSQLKLTLVWNDPAAIPGTAKALVNDLDLVLKDASTSSSWLPWVLDPSPNLTALTSAALRKKDTLNIVEQITLDNPPAGNYVIEIRGSKITTPSQSFALSWQLDTIKSFYWTFPGTIDPLIAKNTHWLRWETNINGQGEIEYATNGNNWRAVGTVQDLAAGYYKWTVPDTLTNAVLRMKIVSDQSMILSDSFTISPRQAIQTGFNCPDSFLLHWNPLQMNQYRLYELGDKYLQPAMLLFDTMAIMKKALHPAIYYAVAPLINGKEGVRSFTINYTTQGAGCYIKAFYLQQQTASAAILHAELGSLYQVDEISFEKRRGNGFVTLSIIGAPTDLQYLFTDNSLLQGENRYRFRVHLKNGLVFYSNEEVVYHLPEVPVIVYPNPVAHHQLLKILVKESGRFILQIYDVQGRKNYEEELNNTITTIPAGRLSKGIYLLKIIDHVGKTFSQKLMVY